jgi:type IX secretion system PorP/SprF family membrane protein
VIKGRNCGTIIGLFICLTMYGQDYHFSGFMQNMVYMNPGYAALPSSAEIGITYRNQWPGIPATFVTYGAALIVPMKALNSGIGLSFTNDIQADGVINRTSGSILYGYLIKLDRNWQIGTGLSASWVMKQFDASALRFPSDLLNELGYSYGPVTYDNYSKSYPDFSIGAIARYDEAISFGISASHLTRPVDTQSALIESRLPLKYTAFVSGKIGNYRQRQGISFEPAVFYSRQKDNEELIWGSMFNLSSQFILGAWIRQDLKFNLDALIVSAGFSWEKYNISYHYDVNLKKISILSTKLAAHEVTFLYRFEYNDEHKVKRFRKSECPAY